MSNSSFTAITNDELATATGGGGKAYTYMKDFRADPKTCFTQARQVAHANGMKLQGSGRDFSMVGPDGEQGGTAYLSGRNNCSIYVY